MRDFSPRKAALILSLILLIAMIPVYAGTIQLQSGNLAVAIVLFLLSFALIFILVFYTIDRFIYQKVKMIYKTINRPGTESGNDLISGKPGRNLFHQVNSDVLEWARNRSEEIEQLRNQEAYRKEFIGNVSHELKTPIFNIQGYILTLLEGGLEDPSINREYLQRAERSVERMITIVEELETITQLESGQLHLDIETFDLSALVKEVSESAELKAAARKINVRTDKSLEKTVKVSADRDRIRQVLTNLIVNSIKYGIEGGTTIIRAIDIEEKVLVEIADNGPGIAESHLPRLFERFYRVDKSRSREQGGSGLGLAIVKHIIEAHQQNIFVRSRLGEGSVFSFTLKKG